MKTLKTTMMLIVFTASISVFGGSESVNYKDPKASQTKGNVDCPYKNNSGRHQQTAFNAQANTATSSKTTKGVQ